MRRAFCGDFHDDRGAWLVAAAAAIGTAIALDIAAALLAIAVLKPWRNRFVRAAA